MDKITFLNKVEEIISKSNYQNLKGSYDDVPEVRFQDDSGVGCAIRFRYVLFGLVSFISLRRDYIEVLKFKITKDEYHKLSNCIKNKIKHIKEQELGMVFKDVTRDNKLKGMLDDKR